jgi:REP-associated tyrosine transposase
MQEASMYYRHSIRLKEYDYSQVGTYFITVCTYQHICIFGDIVGAYCIRPPKDNIHPHDWLNTQGKIAQKEWMKIGEIQNNVELDEYVIMPNHIHGIIVITENRGDAYNQGAHTSKGRMQYASTRGFRSPAKCIGSIVRGFKSAVTSQLFRMCCSKTPIWQRNYYEHVIRNQKSLDKIREYIRNNPANWEKDKENPRSW